LETRKLVNGLFRAKQPVETARMERYPIACSLTLLSIEAARAPRTKSAPGMCQN
jgi:hypothetical protein